MNPLRPRLVSVAVAVVVMLLPRVAVTADFPLKRAA